MPLSKYKQGAAKNIVIHKMQVCNRHVFENKIIAPTKQTKPIKQPIIERITSSVASGSR